MRIAAAVASVVVVVSSISGCGSSSTPSAGTASSASASAAVPTDVVVASPTASTSASASISVGKGVFKATGDPTTEKYSDKKAAREALAAGTGDCAFTPSLTISAQPACYGPIIRYASHPDGSPTSGTLPGSDAGFWSLTEGAAGEACASAQMNYLVSAVSSRVDMMFNMFDMMSCVGNKAGLALPATVGTTTDYKAALTARATMSGITPNTATIERLADSAAGNPVYKSTVSVTITVGGETRTGTAILKHEVTGTDASGKNNYKGKLSMTMTNPTMLGSATNCTGAADAGSVMGGVVKYVKTSATSVKYDMNYAEFCGSTTAPLDSSNNIARTDTFDATTNADGWGANWNYGIFDLDPSNGTGTVAYAWQAGPNDQRTRVMDVKVAQAADGSASGTAWYGFGPDVDGTDTLGTIDGFICNWTGPNGANQSAIRSQATLVALTPPRAVAKSQKQLLTRASGATVFTTTASDSFITYAPANSCNKTSSETGFTFVAETAGAVVLSQTNNISTTATVTNNLVAIPTTTDFTIPTAVDDVGI